MFKAFLECQMSRAKPTSLLAIKVRIFSAILMQWQAIVFINSHLFLCSIYCVIGSH